ncbi:rhodanese-like domain-containing protein [candidate division KSB1 bacterium]
MYRLFIKSQGIITIFLLSVIIGFSFNLISPNGIDLVYSYNADSFISDDLFITLEQAKYYYGKSAALFLDSRNYGMYEKGHIKGALSIPYFDFEKYFKKISSKISKNGHLIIYCGGEKCNSSQKLAATLMDKGYNNVMIFQDGWNQWKLSNLPIEKNQ